VVSLGSLGLLGGVSVQLDEVVEFSEQGGDGRGDKSCVNVISPDCLCEK
jgi:hypothetical protein